MSLVARTRFRVEWGDCSPSGAVFYPNYFRWFDRSVWKLFDEAGHPITEMERRFGTVGIPIVDMQVSFHKPCRLQHDVVLETTAVEWHAKRFKIRHEVSRGSDLLVSCIETRFWGIRHSDNPDRLVSAEIPQEIVAALQGPGRAS